MFTLVLIISVSVTAGVAAGVWIANTRIDRAEQMKKDQQAARLRRLAMGKKLV